MRLQTSRRLMITVLFGFIAVTSVPMLRSESLYVYDLDSLVHLSTDVIDAEITRSYQAHDHALIDVKVTLAHKGGLKKGQTVVVADTDLYRKPDKDGLNSQLLAVGDRLVLFLARAKANDFFRVPKDAVIYRPLPGGMRLIQKDRVYDFFQWMNPGPYVADLSFDPAKPKGMTLK
ncbi:MAG: hypothetical protein ACRELF_11680, partial [Gemmataceae bacterium]